MVINLDNYSRSQFVTLVFEHPVSKPEWYWSEDLELEASGAAILKHCIDLFHNSSVLLTQFRSEQLEQGFWFLLGPKLDVPRLIWDERLSRELREDTIRAMVEVFRQLFSKNPPDTVCYMWWDLVITAYQIRDSALEERIVEALALILKIDSHQCQKAALHGLGHLESATKKVLIETYLKENPHLDLDTQAYAAAAVEGRVQ